ncbi:hypothetical protein M9H77_15696 [Catharanthus roseus]|uniref:Uncharacterized protein n=1 Tax=Catharanthus roseus TaxID=4058 RepID=A0ACC0B121_CATRO|nr:hypothetical protein M9H77_15696 [Catharanthus roseus]
MTISDCVDAAAAEVSSSITTLKLRQQAESDKEFLKKLIENREEVLSGRLSAPSTPFHRNAAGSGDERRVGRSEYLRSYSLKRKDQCFWRKLMRRERKSKKKDDERKTSRGRGVIN